MRIIGGRWKGRRLFSPPTSHDSIRPTSDRLRESLFNILQHGYGIHFEDHRVLDICAGTGALGIEALSRGARFALFIEEAAQARALIRQNMESLGLAGSARIFRRDARKLGAMPPQIPFTLVLIDPPYGKNLLPLCLKELHQGGWLEADAMLVLEEQAEVEIDVPAAYTILEKRIFGETQLVFLRYLSP